MTAKTLNARLNICDGMKRFDNKAENVPNSKDRFSNGPFCKVKL